MNFCKHGKCLYNCTNHCGDGFGMTSPSEWLWTDELVKDFLIWHSGIYANPNPTDSCLDTFKKSKQQKQKDWEIIAYRNKGNDKVYSGDTFFMDKYDVVTSVKRLSDNEVFSVGDLIANMIGDYYSDKSIAAFKIQGNEMFAIMHEMKGIFPIQHLQKAKQPLFKTEDGKDVYEGDEYYEVNAESRVSTIIGKGWYNPSKGNKYFSSVESAKEYVVMNKPCLSVMDAVVEFCKWYKESEVVSGISFENSLKQLVEQKLKQ